MCRTTSTRRGSSERPLARYSLDAPVLEFAVGMTLVGAAPLGDHAPLVHDMIEQSSARPPEDWPLATNVRVTGGAYTSMTR